MTAIVSNGYPVVEIPPHLKDTPVAEGSDVFALSNLYNNQPNEYLLCVAVDASRKPLTMRIVAIGGRSQATLSIPDIMRSAVSDGATGLIFLHNHPNGDLTPSRADNECLEALEDAADTLQIKVVGMYIVSKDSYRPTETQYERDQKKSERIIHTNYLAMIATAVETAGNSMMRIVMLLLSIAALIFLIDLRSGNIPKDSLQALIDITVLYPLSWCASTGGKFVREVME